MPKYKVAFENGHEIEVNAPDEAGVKAHVARVAEVGRSSPTVGFPGIDMKPSTPARGEIKVAQAGVIRTIAKVKD